MTKHKVRMLGSIFATLALALGLMACGAKSDNTAESDSTSTAAASNGQATKLTFVLDFIADGRYAPFYLALKNGYYRDEGLDVNIIPAKGGNAALQSLASGNAQIGYLAVPSFILGAAANADVKLVSVQYQRAPYAVFSLNPGANVTRLSQFAGLTITSNAGSFTPGVIKGLMSQEGLDPNSVKFNDVDPSTKNSLLTTGRVPAIETFILTKPAIEKTVPANKHLVTFLLADHGLDLYGNGIIVPNSYLKSHAAVVSKFVKASLLGWRESIKDPKSAADAIEHYIPTLDPAVTSKQVEIVNDLAVTDYTKEHGLGTIDPKLMSASYEFVKNSTQGKTLPPLDSLYTTNFLPAKPINP